MVDLKLYNRQQRMQIAIETNEYLHECYQDEIDEAVRNTTIYPNVDTVGNPVNEGYNTEIFICNAGSVECLYNIVTADEGLHLGVEQGKLPATVGILVDGNSTLLNFASFKNPGGMFLKGSPAQEEALCHNSILYPILDSFKE